MGKILTISVAAYKTADTIGRTLDSLVNSDVLDDLEIIIVNDGSPDDTPQVAAKYAVRYPNSVKLIDKENGGWGSTVNASLEAATGKYYKILDSDDYFETANLKPFIEYLKGCSTDIVFTDFDYVYPGSVKHVTYPYQPKKAYITHNIRKILMHGIAVRTEVIQGKLKLMEHCYYTDNEFSVKAMQLSENFSYLPIKIYNYVMGNSSQSVSKAGYVRNAYDHEKLLDVIMPIVRHDPKFKLANENHYQYLPGDQLYIFMLDKKFKNDFYRYYQKAKLTYPDLVKKMKIYIKFACKSPIFYRIFSSIIASKR